MDSVVVNSVSQYEKVIQVDTLSAYLTFLKDLLFVRIPMHAHTSNSRAIQNIQQFGTFSDQLKLHIAEEDMLSFLNAFTRLLVSEYNIRRCILKVRDEDSKTIAKYRNMVYQIWRRVLAKVEGIVNWASEKNTEKTHQDVFQGIRAALGLEQTALNQDDENNAINLELDEKARVLFS